MEGSKTGLNCRFKGIIPIISFWSKRERLAKEMAEFGIEERRKKGRRGEWTEEEREEPPNMVMIVEEETGSLCEQCRTEEEEKSVRKKEADEAAEKLSQKLNQHVTQMNRTEVERQKRREKVGRNWGFRLNVTLIHCPGGTGRIGTNTSRGTKAGQKAS
jgi:hypothetical protein